jgi:hypothetical protein
MKTTTMLALAGLGVIAAMVACKSDPPKNPEPIYPEAGAYNPMMPQPEAGTPVMVTPQPEAGAPEAANPIAAVFDAAAQQLLEANIKQLQPKNAPGMKAEGPIIGGMLQEGQVVEGQAMFMPGKCYTVIGTSPAGVTELDVQVSWMTLLPGLQPVIAIDGKQGPQAIVAGSPNCYKIPQIVVIATPVKITVKATKGSGLAGAQLFAK